MFEVLEHVVDLAGDFEMFGAGVCCVLRVGLLALAVEGKSRLHGSLSIGVGGTVFTDRMAGTH